MRFFRRLPVRCFLIVDRRHVLDIRFALQIAQAATAMSHDAFAYAMCQSARFLYTPSPHQANLVVYSLALMAG